MPNHPLEATVSDYVKKELSSRMRELMVSREMNLDALVEITGIHVNTLRAYISGERLPRVPQLFLLADAIDAPLDWLTGFGDWEGYQDDDELPEFLC